MARLTVDKASLDEVVQDALATAPLPLPRVSAIVASRDEILWSGAGGFRQYFADSRQPEGNVTLQTPFAMFSSTKFVTCLCALQILESGQIGLDDYAEKWIPELRGKRILTGYSDAGEEVYEEPTSKVTVRDLFCHTGGLPYVRGDPMLERYQREHNLEIQVEGFNGDRNAITGIPHNFTPGSKLQYSTGIDHLGYIVEAVSGLDLEDYTLKYLFEPLEITDGVYRRDESYMAQQPNLVTPVATAPGETSFTPAPFTLPINPVSCGGGSGLHISAESYIKLLQALLNGGTYAATGHQILKPETVDLLFTAQFTNDSDTQFGDALREWQNVNQDPFHTSPDGSISGVPHRRRGWGLGSALNLEDLPGGRKSGTLYGSGFGDTFCWVDRKSGIAATFMVNTAPSRSPGVYEFWKRWENAIYASLKSQ